MAVGIIYGLLLGVFLSVHYLLTLRTLPACLLTPRVILYLLPRLSVFAFPIAVCAGLGMLVDWLYLTDQYFLFISLHRLRRQWWRIMHGVALSAGLIYFAVCGWLAPLYYQRAKQEMVAQTVALLKGLPPGQLHELGRGCVIGWRGQEAQRLYGVRLVHSRGAHTVIVTAQRAHFEETGMTLKDGVIAHMPRTRADKNIHHAFSSLSLSYTWSGVGLGGAKEKQTPVRMQPLHALWGSDYVRSRYEIGVRVASGLWLWCLPFMLLALLRRGNRFVLPAVRDGNGNRRGVAAFYCVGKCVVIAACCIRGCCASWQSMSTRGLDVSRYLHSVTAAWYDSISCS